MIATTLLWTTLSLGLVAPPQGRRRDQVLPRRATLGVEIDSHAFTRCFEGSEERARERLVAEFLPLLNDAFTPCTGLVWELGPLVIWEDTEEDPYIEIAGQGYEIWGRFAGRWGGRGREFDKAVLFYGQPFGFGGLGGGRFVLIGDPWGAWCHEISHCYDNGHGANGSIEHGSMSNTMDRRLFRLPVRNPYSHTEVDQMLRQIEREKSAYPVLEGFDDPVRPYARLDVVVLEPGSKGAKPRWIDIDVLGNDLDVNGDELSLGEFDSRSRLDGEVEVVEVKGRELLRYTPAHAVALSDGFGYTVTDETGLTDRGNVLVQVIGPLVHEYAYEICCLEGEGTRCLSIDDEEKLQRGTPPREGYAWQQQWRFVEAGRGQLKIVHAETEEVLQVETRDGGKVKLGEDSAAATHRWRVTHAGGPFFTIRSAKTRQLLCAPEGGEGFALRAEEEDERKREWREQRWALGLVPDSALEED